jgi:NitT/TauT family transport system permease protein
MGNHSAQCAYAYCALRAWTIYVMSRRPGRIVARKENPLPGPEMEDVLRVLGARRIDILIKVGLPRSMRYFFASLEVAITLAFVGTTVSEMTAPNEGIGYLLVSAGSSIRMPLAFTGPVVIGAMAMYELFAIVEKHTAGWAHRGAR